MEARAIAVILAAGEGKRMQSILPKVLHQLAGKPLIEHVVQTSLKADMVRTIVVVGHRRDMVISALDAYPVEFVVQKPQRGTGHAMQQVVKYLGNYGGTLAVLLGDAPFVTATTLQELITQHQTDGAAITMLTAELDDPTGYGHIVRGADGSLEKIVEDGDATDEERAIREINSGIGCFSYGPLCRALGALDTQNEQQEYYLTDTIEILHGEGLRLGARVAEDSLETWGINDFQQLRAAERIWRERQAAASAETDEAEAAAGESETSFGDPERSESGFYDQVYKAGGDNPPEPTEGDGTPAMTGGYPPIDTTGGDEPSTAPSEV